MKNVKNLVLTGAVCSMLFLGACNDDGNDPVPGGGTTTKTCKITSTTDTDGSTVYTWDGNNIAKIVEDYEGDITTYNYNYVSGKLTEIVEDWDSIISRYKITYEGNNVSRVDVYYDGDLYEYYNVKWNTDGTLMMVDNFFKDTEDKLFSSSEYVYANGRLSKIVQTIDSDDNGTLDGEDDVSTISILVVDDKANPFYGIPNYLMDFTDITSLTKNNINAATYDYNGEQTAFAVTYEYNSDNLPSKASVTDDGDIYEINMNYTCE